MLGDCLERMKEIPDGSVDLTVTSPPYDNLRTYNNSLDWGELKKEVFLFGLLAMQQLKEVRQGQVLDKLYMPKR